MDKFWDGLEEEKQGAQTPNWVNQGKRQGKKWATERMEVNIWRPERDGGPGELQQADPLGFSLGWLTLQAITRI